MYPGWVRFFHGTPLTSEVWDEVRRLVEPDPGHVVGHSYGGQRALDYALSHQVDRLTLLCTRATPFPPFLEAAAAVRRGEVGGTLERWFRPQEAGPVVDYARRCLEQADRSRWALDLEEIARYRCDLARIQVPVLCIAAEFDTVGTPAIMEEMARQLPSGRFILWRGGGHMSPFLEPQRLAQLLSLRW